jgi:hypothetical protein
MAKQRDQGKYGKPEFNQARKIAIRFGGESHLADAIGVSRITVYRWQYRRPYGSDGLIPSAAISKIRTVARLQGILLTPEDWVPERIRYEDREPMLAPTIEDLLQ